MLLRNKRRLDYKVFHETGAKVDKAETDIGDEDIDMETEQKVMLQQITSQQGALTEDVNDFMDENPIKEISENVDDLDSVISRVEEFRSRYRSLHEELKSFLGDAYEEDYGEKSRKVISTIKAYILLAKESRQEIAMMENALKVEKKVQKSEFLKLTINNGNRIMTQFESEFNVNLEKIPAKELQRRYKEILEINRQADSIPERFPDMMSNSTCSEDETKLKLFMKKYESFIILKDAYVGKVRTMFEKRELDKEKLFKESSLNIKLGKFVGYGSYKDIYSFQDDFEKLHLRVTPVRLLPDLLKNNFLGGSALSLVKDVENIEEIWQRLKRVFGDPKILLHNKLEEINQVDLTTRSKSPEKTIDALQRVITTMKDLIKISKQHKIENELYYGNGLERITKLLGDVRVTKWLTRTCDMKLTKEESWKDMMEFLEKESSVLQQKLLLFGKERGTRCGDYSRESNRLERRNEHQSHITETTEEERQLCSFCGGSGHVMTNGPGFTKVIQYFACKKFVDMTPAERFKEIRKKGFCFQCLLPGAPLKHKDGKCQTDFVC